MQSVEVERALVAGKAQSWFLFSSKVIQLHRLKLVFFSFWKKKKQFLILHNLWFEGDSFGTTLIVQFLSFLSFLSI